MSSNEPIPTIAAAPPTQPGEVEGSYESFGTPTWPSAIGIINIVFGVGGIALSFWGAIGPYLMETLFDTTNFTMESWEVFQGYNAAMSVVYLLLSVMLLIAGIRVLNRQRVGVRWTRTWALLRLVHGLGMAWLMLVMQQATFSEYSGSGEPYWIIFAFTFISTLIWTWSYPVFLLIWFRRKKIKQHIQEHFNLNRETSL